MVRSLSSGRLPLPVAAAGSMFTHNTSLLVGSKCCPQNGTVTGNSRLIGERSMKEPLVGRTATDSHPTEATEAHQAECVILTRKRTPVDAPQKERQRVRA